MALWLAINAPMSTPIQSPASEDPPPEWLVRNVIRWLPLVHRWHPDFPELDPAWILGLIAQESQGFPHVIADDVWGSTGLMQVGPRSWIGTRARLLDSAYNIYTGMRLFSDTLEKSGNDVRRALGAYNCGFVGLDANLCGSRGGLAYADRILDYWVPVFRANLWMRAGEDDLIGDWLTELDYGDGLGKWDVESSVDVMEAEKEVCRIILPERRFRPRTCMK